MYSVLDSELMCLEIYLKGRSIYLHWLMSLSILKHYVRWTVVMERLLLISDI